MEDVELPADLMRAQAGNVVPAEQYLAGHLDDDAGWRIESMGSAAWAMGKLAEAKAVMQALDDLAASYHREVDRWQGTATEPMRRTIDYFTAKLQQFALAERDERKVKTLVLPNGQIRTHATTRPRLVIDDEAAFIDWAKANQPDALTTVVKPRVSNLRYGVDFAEGAVWGKLFDQETGEVIPGCHAEFSPTSATVHVS